MGLFDYYGTTQLAVGADPYLNHFTVGDTVPTPDGVYVGHEGVVVVVGGKFVAEFPHLLTKWEDKISPVAAFRMLAAYDVVEYLQQCHCGTGAWLMTHPAPTAEP